MTAWLVKSGYGAPGPPPGPGPEPTLRFGVYLTSATYMSILARALSRRPPQKVG